MSMLYIWWAGIILALGVMLVAMTIPIAVGQYRLYALSRVVQYVGVIVVTLLLSQLYSPFIAIVVSIILVMVTMMSAHVPAVRRRMAAVLRQYQPRLVTFVSRHGMFEFISDRRGLSDKVGVSSYEELLAIVKGAAFIDGQLRSDIVRFIPLLEKKVDNFMKPVSSIVSIQEDDVIGPLLLDELHSSGQQSFLVLSKSGMIKGTIKLTQLTESSKEVTRVQDIMDRHLVELSAAQSVQSAVQHLVHEQVWLGVVRDAREPSVVSLQDIAGALLGKEPR